LTVKWIFSGLWHLGETFDGIRALAIGRRAEQMQIEKIVLEKWAETLLRKAEE
jgi:hypothetical protein